MTGSSADNVVDAGADGATGTAAEKGRGPVRQCRSRRRLPADLHRLRRRDRRAAHALRPLLVRDRLHRAALLRAARHALRGRSRHAAAVARRHRRAAGVRARAGGGALRRGRPQARPPAEIRRPARARPRARRHDGSLGRRAPGRGRGDRARCRCTAGGCGGGASTRRWRSRRVVVEGERRARATPSCSPA